MSTTIAVALRRATDLFGNLMGQRLLLVMMMLLFAFAWSPTHVGALSLPPAPTLSVVVYTAPNDYFGVPTFRAVVKPIPHVFNAYLEVPGGLPYKGDLYFGIAPPGSNKIFTWIVDGGTLSVREGLVPIARGIDMINKSSFSVSSILGRDIQYAFTGGEPSGMYLIMALLVTSNSDPSDEQNWLAANLVPLIFRP
jgi:hypothetical protein